MTAVGVAVGVGLAVLVGVTVAVGVEVPVVVRRGVGVRVGDGVRVAVGVAVAFGVPAVVAPVAEGSAGGSVAVSPAMVTVGVGEGGAVEVGVASTRWVLSATGVAVMSRCATPDSVAVVAAASGPVPDSPPGEPGLFAAGSVAVAAGVSSPEVAC